MDLALYEKMSVDERAELDGATKRAIVQGIVGHFLPVTFCEIHDPLEVAARVLAADAAPASGPLPVAEAGQRGGLVR